MSDDTRRSAAGEAPAAAAVPQPASGDDAWERAYARFQTPEQEIRKFVWRLTKLGARRWPRDAAIVDLFCGRGNGLHALSRLGFSNLTGVDLSPTLAAQYAGPARIVVDDCRRLPFPSDSFDIAIVQGGLHHLPVLPDDLDQTLGQIRRVLRPGGRLIVVEPWLTPFLVLLHAVARRRTARALWPKLDAYQTMVENEIATFEQWLSQPRLVLEVMNRHFTPALSSTAWGKLHYIGLKTERAADGT
ncbi:MAG TPA: class I SAM-dependent methyltransferase [Gemmatimonadaceae bacterium]|nr:class I SAM-dependent methyltransferase [Gemmatimonadaceae bacterium]